MLRVLGIQCLHFWWKFHLTQTSFKHRYSVLQDLKSSGVLACTLWNHFYTNSTIKITIRNRYLLKTNEQTRNTQKTHQPQNPYQIHPIAGVLSWRMLKWPLNIENDILQTKLIICLGLSDSHSFKFCKVKK